jgi:hypothetical protein
MGIEFLFVLLSLLYGFESLSSIARSSGIWTGNIYNGIVVQNALSLGSRLIMFIFMPVMGFFFDTGNFVPTGKLLIANICAITALILVYVTRNYSFYFLVNVALHVKNKGRLGYTNQTHDDLISLKSYYDEKSFVIKYIMAYIPYYAAWPLTIFLLGEYNEYRATLIALPTVFTGLNTLSISLYIDPYLSRFVEKSQENVWTNASLINLRICSYIISIILVLIFVFFWNV